MSKKNLRRISILVTAQTAKNLQRLAGEAMISHLVFNAHYIFAITAANGPFQRQIFTEQSCFPYFAIDDKFNVVVGPFCAIPHLFCWSRSQTPV